MPVRKATATWEGSLREGKGTMKPATAAWEGPFTFSTRFEDKPGTNPEELVGAALAGCFSMDVSGNLGRAGYSPERIDTTANVTLERTDDGPRVTRIHLEMEARVPGIENDEFQKIAAAVKDGCPISNLLTGAEITLDAKLVS